MNKVNMVLLALLFMLLSGCSSTMKKYVDTDEITVSTQMSSTVFLEPVSDDKKTVFLQIKNTSDQQIDITNNVASELRGKGYKVVEDPEEAHYWIQANILKIGKINKEDQDELFGNGRGAGLVGGMIGGQFGDGRGTALTGLLGALTAIAVDSSLENTLYTMVTDLQISQRVASHTEEGNQEPELKKHQTRVVSTAEKVNAEFSEVQPLLEEGLVSSISGLL